MSDQDNTAAGSAAGYILQLERALHHLAHAGPNASVAVEHVDDVAVIENGKPVLQEQDKNTLANDIELLGDRSHALWRTLHIWATQRALDEGRACERFLLFVNRQVSTPVACLIKARARGEAKAADIVASLTRAAAGRPGTRIQKLVDSVLAFGETELESLIGLVEIVEAGEIAADRSLVANGLGVNPGANAEDILDGLLGWLTRVVRDEWRAGRPAIISRRSVLLQRAALEGRQARNRLLPRASSDVLPSEAQRARALARPFVEHLGRIAVEDEDIVTAVDHFLKFNIEKHRLVREGDIPEAEWRHRGDRLTERWSGIMRRSRRELSTRTAWEIGQKVLADVTYDHREALDGHACAELYMTSGHYHRLADEDAVWWDPRFIPRTPHES